MDEQTYFQGFLVATVVIVIEHATLFRILHPNKNDSPITSDRKVLAKFILGTLAILCGCAWIAWQSGYAIAVLAPIAASMSGLVIVAAYVGRWFIDSIKEASYRRGRIHGLADKADIRAEERDGGR